MTGKQAVQAAAPTVSLLNKFAQPRPRAGPEPGDRAGRPRQPRSRGRARLAQPRRQGLHWSRGAAPVRVQPGADDQHVRAVRAHAGRRRVRQPDVLAVRDAGHDRREPQAVRARPTASATRGSGPTSRASNETDPSNPGGCVPDPGGAPPGHTGPQTSAPACPARRSAPLRRTRARCGAKATARAARARGRAGHTAGPRGRPRRRPAGAARASRARSARSPPRSAPATAPTVSTPRARRARSRARRRACPPPAHEQQRPRAARPRAQQAQQLLNYLLSP